MKNVQRSEVIELLLNSEMERLRSDTFSLREAVMEGLGGIQDLEPSELEENYEYDAKGNRTKVTDARGYSTTTTYDDKNRVKTVKNALNHLTTYVYDGKGNLTNIIRDRSLVNDQKDNKEMIFAL